MAAELVGPIVTTPGMAYTISLDVGRLPSGSAAITGNFNFGGYNTTLTGSSTALGAQSWVLFATSTNTLIDITGYTNSAVQQLLISNVSVVASPGAGVIPSILTPPGNATNYWPGGSASFSETVGGTGPFSYQW